MRLTILQCETIGKTSPSVDNMWSHIQSTVIIVILPRKVMLDTVKKTYFKIHGHTTMTMSRNEEVLKHRL